MVDSASSNNNNNPANTTTVNKAIEIKTKEILIKNQSWLTVPHLIIIIILLILLQ